MSEQKIIKIISQHTCPHCQKSIIISTKVATPWVDFILREEDMKKAKDSVRSKIEKVKFNNEEEKTNILEWLDNKDNLFGQDESEMILYQLLNTIQKKDKNKEDKKTPKETKKEEVNNIK